jgi:hypothetical protein
VIVGAYCTSGKKERCIQGFVKGNLRENGHLEDQVVNGRIQLRWIFRRRDGGMD